ncbi:MAG: hypothetical protein ABJ308_09380 [Halieaceae bacterium]
MSQYYLIPKKLARAYPALGRAAQWLEAVAFRFLFWFIKLFPPEYATGVAATAFGWVGPRSLKARKADTNLAIAFPEQSAQWRQQTSRQIFQHLGRSAAELILLDRIWAEREQRLEFVLQDKARAHIENKDAAVFVTAHVGAWQVTNLLAARYDLSVSTVYAPESNIAMREIMLKLRQSLGVKLIATDAGVRPLIRELHNGDCIGLAMDTRLDSGQLVPYFGRDALTNTSAARLALRSGATLMPIRGESLGKARFRITVYDPIVSSDPDASMDEQALDITRQINQCFESWIRDTPGQWICLKRRWPKAHKL